MSDSTQFVPDDEVVLVEYPGIVRNVDAALATLGGPAALAARQAVGAILQLRFRPGDPLSHPLIADRQPARGMLLRIACPPAGAAAPNGTPVLGSAGPSVTVTGSGEDRGGDGGAAEAGAGRVPGSAGPSASIPGNGGERGGDGGAAEASALPVEAAQGTGVRAHVVACVRSAYRFTGLADFQYVAHDGRPPVERVRCWVLQVPRQTLALTSPRNPAKQPRSGGLWYQGLHGLVSWQHKSWCLSSHVQATYSAPLHSCRP